MKATEFPVMREGLLDGVETKEQAFRLGMAFWSFFVMIEKNGDVGFSMIARSSR